MDTLPVELIRLVFDYCEPSSVRSLRAVRRTLAEVGYDYLLPPKFTALRYRNDIGRLYSIAHHDRLRACIQSIVINLSEVDGYDMQTPCDHVVQVEDDGKFSIFNSAWPRYEQMPTGRKHQAEIHTRGDELRQAILALPNLRDFAVTFTQYPLGGNDEARRDGQEKAMCRRMDRTVSCKNLDAIISALQGVRLDSFSIDRFPFEVFKIPVHRKHWFANVRSFDSLSRLDLTIDQSGIRGPQGLVKAINGLGLLLQLSSQLRHLKLAFHPYSTSHAKFVLLFRDLLHGFTFSQLTDLTLEGVSCTEKDLLDFLSRHTTLVRLRLGGRGLSKPHMGSLGGIHLHEGTFRSLFAGMRKRMSNLERLHLEGVFECELHGLASLRHETYNFYPVTDEAWQAVERPKWARASRRTISCLPFEQYVLSGGPYPGNTLMAQA